MTTATIALAELAFGETFDTNAHFHRGSRAHAHRHLPGWRPFIDTDSFYACIARQFREATHVGQSPGGLALESPPAVLIDDPLHFRPELRQLHRLACRQRFEELDPTVGDDPVPAGRRRVDIPRPGEAG